MKLGPRQRRRCGPISTIVMAVQGQVRFTLVTKSRTASPAGRVASSFRRRCAGSARPDHALSRMAAQGQRLFQLLGAHPILAALPRMMRSFAAGRVHIAVRLHPGNVAGGRTSPRRPAPRQWPRVLGSQHHQVTTRVPVLNAPAAVVHMAPLVEVLFLWEGSRHRHPQVSVRPYIWAMKKPRSIRSWSTAGSDMAAPQVSHTQAVQTLPFAASSHHDKCSSSSTSTTAIHVTPHGPRSR